MASQGDLKDAKVLAAAGKDSDEAVVAITPSADEVAPSGVHLHLRLDSLRSNKVKLMICFRLVQVACAIIGFATMASVADALGGTLTDGLAFCLAVRGWRRAYIMEQDT